MYSVRKKGNLLLCTLLLGNVAVNSALAIFLGSLASGLLAAILGGVVIPATLLVKKADITVKDRLYYPTTLGVSALCWFIVIGNWLFWT